MPKKVDTLNSREDLILSAVNLARFIARKFCQRWHDKFPLDEAESVCFLALIEAADNFDPLRGFKFTTFAGSYMEFSLKSYSTEKKQSGLSGAKRDQRLTKDLRFIDLTKPLDKREDEPNALVDLLPDRSPNPEDLIVGDPLRLVAQVAKHATLTKRQREVLAAILFNSGNLNKAAEDLGVTHQAVRQNLHFATRSLRTSNLKGSSTRKLRRCPNNLPVRIAVLRLSASALRFYKSRGTADWWLWPSRREAA